MILVLLSGLAACSRSVSPSKNDVYHQVRSGETLYRIGKAYGVSVKELAVANRLSDPSRLEVGQRLRIPHARRELPVSLITPREATARRSEKPRGAAGDPKLAWPLLGGTVTSGFGQRGRGFHDGIDISAPAGTPVHAAQDGEVIYSDALRGYGNVIIVRHPGGFVTVYAHNRSNQARERQRVRQGEVIGSVGDSGRTSGANLHFEVRQDNIAHDPLEYLPPLRQIAAPGPPTGNGRYAVAQEGASDR
ncbi:MAG: M23 family metallopeptidase [Candidatus Binatia bacterium]